MPKLVLGPLLRYVGETQATVWVETDAAARVEVEVSPAEPGREAAGGGHGQAPTFQVQGHHYALVLIDGLEPDRVYDLPGRARRRAGLAGRWPPRTAPPSRPAPSAPCTATTRCGSPSGPAGSPPPTSRRGRCRRAPTASGQGRRRPVRLRPADARRRPRHLAGPPAAAGRPDLRRRHLRAGAGVHPLAPRRPAAARPRGGRLRGVHAAVLGGLGRPGPALAAVDGPDGDDLRRPRHQRRLEHLGRLGRAHAGQPLVGRADRQRAGLLLAVPAPGQPVPGRPGRRPGLAPRCATPATPPGCCASSPTGPTARSRGPAGATRATSAGPAWW